MYLRRDGDVTVVLDTNLTPELLEEGFVRELISKIQTMRKEAGFEVMDHITVSAMGNDKIDADSEKICSLRSGHEVLADESGRVGIVSDTRKSGASTEKP